MSVTDRERVGQAYRGSMLQMSIDNSEETCTMSRNSLDLISLTTDMSDYSALHSKTTHHLYYSNYNAQHHFINALNNLDIRCFYK